MVIVVRSRKVYLGVLRLVSLVALVFPFNIANARALELFHVAYNIANYIFLLIMILWFSPLGFFIISTLCSPLAA